MDLKDDFPKITFDPSHRLGKLLQKTHVARVEMSDIGDPMLNHGNAFDTHAKGEAGDAVRIVSIAVEAQLAALFGHAGEDRRIDHSTTKKLYPS